MRLTEAQKDDIRLYREKNLGYGEIAKKMGLSKNTVCAFCIRHQLGGFRGGTAIPVHGEQAQAPSNESQMADSKAEPSERKRRGRKREFHPVVSVQFAEEPNEEAVKDVLRILSNIAFRTNAVPDRKKK